MSQRILNNRIGLTFLLLLLFVVNFSQTRLELLRQAPEETQTGYQIAQSFMELEGNLDFSGFEGLGEGAAAAHTLSYFVLFPLLVLFVGLRLVVRSEISPYRVMTLAMALSYLAALCFFILYPVPERWAFPPANAPLLSDAWSVKWIETFRTFKAVDNTFPSLPAAFMLVVIFVAYRYRLKFRHPVALAGAAVILSCFTLGIHWVPDLLMGGFLGLFTASAAVMWDQRLVQTLGEIEPETVSRSGGLIPPRAGEKKTTFISYRRETGSIMARIVQSELKKRGHGSFLDVDDLGPKKFGTRLLKEIESVPNFVVVLSPGSMDRCKNEDDWLRREIAHAIATKRNIVPLMVDEFQYPSKEKIPAELEELTHHNGVTYSHEYFDATFDKLSDFLQRK